MRLIYWLLDVIRVRCCLNQFATTACLRFLNPSTTLCCVLCFQSFTNAVFYAFSPSPKFGSSKTDRLQFLSPAAQTLASKKLGICTSTDRALKASYTPSPSHRTPGSKTPTITTPSPGRTPTQKSKTPSGRSASKRRETADESLTDNLLNLPKRPKAKDFFWYIFACRCIDHCFVLTVWCEMFSVLITSSVQIMGRCLLCPIATSSQISEWLWLNGIFSTIRLY